MFWKFNEKIILQFASRRGGSTLLAQVLSAEPNVGFIDQPFDLWKPDTKRGQIIKSYLPHKEESQFFELNSNERSQVKSYLKKFHSLSLNQLSTHKRAKKQVLKIVNAHGLIDELSNSVPSISIVMLRHPCSQALSVVRNQWGTCEKSFLNSKIWSKQYLSNDQLRYGLKISETGSYLDRAVLNWCLEWHFPMKFAQSKFKLLFYEKMVITPKAFVEKLFSYLEFKNISGGIDVIERPSRSSVYSSNATIEKINSGSRPELLSSWRDTFSEKDLIRIQDILNLFEVNCYSVFNDSPLIDG